jgi:hypothetical protein
MPATEKIEFERPSRPARTVNPASVARTSLPKLFRNAQSDRNIEEIVAALRFP